jgi:hypothetical protein
MLASREHLETMPRLQVRFFRATTYISVLYQQSMLPCLC